ncbi:hypothetical protein HYC85_000463 [Camellia sinensis]|uniref:Uncharacterized protein n=1 Tax=Camellia sinensis TaxID=4442 RepID=A0A7J7I4E7_CAMSI|nr:hypothetical protein HYC85_000463 [Camellia sinensis]
MRLHQIKEGKSSMHHSKLTQSQLGWHREESPIICKLIPRSLVRNQTQQEKKKKKDKDQAINSSNFAISPESPNRSLSAQQTQ